ncbi:NAD--DNA ADP-ribosyltransferase [Cladobotryum mycophilum]|uniref:NAD--DNA ADP-ribosyltransferase n=1 Tax=Cladobotryum mycophilum TaxID=491253 RepID=A0ABR0T2R8_9HYPO
MSGSFNPDLFLAATLDWQERVDLWDVFRRINSYFTNGVTWRPDTLRDFRSVQVPSSAQRLVRWDGRHPSDIFRGGFEPRGDDDSQYNLAEYVRNNQPSPFVSTARCFSQNNCLMRWRPFQTPFARNRAGFEYEVFAYGGIDVNECLGRHQYQGQNEILFPGGIRREFIRSALEYDGSGNYVRYWINEQFDPSANGPNHSPLPYHLPNHLFPDGVEVAFYHEDEDQHPELEPNGRRWMRGAGEDDNTDDFMIADGQLQEIIFNGASLKSLSDDYAPEAGHEYAISILGTSMVLTCVNGTDLVLDVWKGLNTQRFLCTDAEGYTGFLCRGAGGGKGRYLGFNAYEWLACSATKQDRWEYFFLRADPAGGFQMLMYKNEKLAPVSRDSRTTLKMMATSSTRFGFTRLDDDAYHGTWDTRSSRGTDIPQDGSMYEIKILGTSKAFTCVNGTDLKILELNGSDTQLFRCTTYEGHMGFICKGADGGRGRYLGFVAKDWLACSAYYQRDWEHIHAKASPSGGFMLWMKKDSHQAPVARVGEDAARMVPESSTYVSFIRRE